MSSQGSNSIRVASGVAFEPMSGDLFSRDVSTSSTSSTDPGPEVAFRPVDKGAVEPA